ncbi:MAG: CsbD family protein [Anaerolineaceae bacterium]|nr:MAG: CsbD family protein [Anaerolineaceae bacterium]
MNWDKIKGHWTQTVGDVRKQWGELTEDEVEQIAGDRDKLLGKLQERYGMAREEANRQIDEWAEKLKFDD